MSLELGSADGDQVTKVPAFGQHTMHLSPLAAHVDREPTGIPSSCLYKLSEWEAMEKYIGESMAVGLIRPSSSPLGAGFFLCTEEGWFSLTYGL